MSNTNIKDFKDIVQNPDILDSLDKLKFQTATLVQSLAIPPASEGKSLVIEAKTGSGKTLAFAIPMLSRLKQQIEQTNQKIPFGLVVTPTRELAVQIETVFTSLVPEISPVTLIGGSSYHQQKSKLNKDSRLIIGTPGRILDAIDRGDLDLRKIKVFALDEVDEMFSIGFTEDVEAIINETPEEAQGLFVSATISPRVLSLAEKFLKDAQHISASSQNEAPPQITHIYAEVEQGVSAKPIAICNFLDTMNPDSAIIFCNTKSETELVERFIRRRGYNARRINSDLSQSQRNRVMDLIHSKELRYLIATDIAARGIDISELELVINFSTHQQAESYVHRTGRTGRAGKAGTALSLVSPHDFLGFQAVKKLAIDLQKINLPTEEEVAAAQLANLTKNLPDKLNSRDLILAKELLETKTGKDREEFEATLSSYDLDNIVNEEAISLDEELKKSAARKSNNFSNKSKPKHHSHQKGRNQKKNTYKKRKSN